MYINNNIEAVPEFAHLQLSPLPSFHPISYTRTSCLSKVIFTFKSVSSRWHTALRRADSGLSCPVVTVSLGHTEPSQPSQPSQPQLTVINAFASFPTVSVK